MKFVYMCSTKKTFPKRPFPNLGPILKQSIERGSGFLLNVRGKIEFILGFSDILGVAKAFFTLAKVDKEFLQVNPCNLFLFNDLVLLQLSFCSEVLLLDERHSFFRDKNYIFLASQLVLVKGYTFNLDKLH